MSNGNDGGQRGGNRANGGGNNQRRERNYNVEAEKQAFFAYITDRANKAEYAKLLGPDIDVERFVSIAIDAVVQKPDLLEPGLRPSLFFSLKKAAKQGLKPDGKEGALIIRYDNDAKMKLVQWQPMIWGIVKAGRRAGALKKLTAELVFIGEPFRFRRGDEESIEHEWVPEIRSKAYQHLRPAATDGYEDDGPKIDYLGFWDEVVAAYCIVEAPDGTKVRRAMPTERLLNLRDFAKAQGGPWRGVWVDEMMLKATVLFTMKHVETDTADEKVKAFRDALEQDMDIDLDNDGHVQTIEHDPPPAASARPALAAPNEAMSRLTDAVLGRGQQREAVTVGSNEQNHANLQREQDRQQTSSTDQKERQTQDTTKRNEGSGEQQRPEKNTNQTSVNDGEKHARTFVTRITGEIAAAAGRKDGEDYLATLIASPRNQASLGRLRTSYNAMLGEVVLAFLAQGVVDKIGGIQSASPVLYDEIVAKLQGQPDDKRAA